MHDGATVATNPTAPTEITPSIIPATRPPTKLTTPSYRPLARIASSTFFISWAVLKRSFR